MSPRSPELQARRRRIARIRRRVIGGVCGLFAAATAAIAVQMATGHDPALAKSSHTGGAGDVGSAAGGGGAEWGGGGWSDGDGYSGADAGWSGGGNGYSTPSTGPSSGGSATSPGSSSGGVAPLTTGQS